MAATSIIDHVIRPHVASVEDLYLKSEGLRPQSHHAAGPSEPFIPGNLPSGLQRIVDGVIRLFDARSMQEHCTAMHVLARGVVWDAPPFLMSRKGSVRVSSYLAKFMAHQRFLPSLVQVRRVGVNGTLLEVSGTLEVRPHRTLLLLPTLLLPESVPIRTTLLIGVSGTDTGVGVAEMVAVKFHNLPALPNFLRATNGLIFGTVPHLLEPLWSKVAEFAGDDFYKRKREQSLATRHPDSKLPALDATKDAIYDTANGVMDFGVDSVHSLWDGMGYLYTNALEALGFGLGRARVYTEGAATLASDLAGTAYGTAASLAGTAAHAATGAAAAAADTASRTAGTAYGTATGAAQNVYDTAAGAVGAAAQGGRQTLEAGRAAGRTAADRTTVALDTTAVRARQGADDLQRGYDLGKSKPVELPTTRSPAGMSAH